MIAESRSANCGQLGGCIQGPPGYAATLLARGQALPDHRWLTDAVWLGGLLVAAGIAWHGLAALPSVRLAVISYVAVEGLWYLWSKLRFRHLSRLCDDGPDTSRLATHFSRFLQLRDVFCIRQFLSGWFLGAPVEAVLRGNVEDFVAYGFYCKLLHQLSEGEQGAIRQFVNEVEAAWGLTFPPGFDPGLPFMAHVWEPLRAYHKPLALFALTELLARIAHVLMWLMGFRPARQDRFTYWLAPPLAPPSPGATGNGPEVLSPPLSPVAQLAAPLLRRHSTGDVVAEAVHVAADAVHHAAEHALDATLSVTSTAAAAVAAQHPHGGVSPLSPRVPSPLPALALGAGQGAGVPAGRERAAVVSRRRNKGDSATDFAGSSLADAVGAATEPVREEVAAPASPFISSPTDSEGSGAGAGASAVGPTTWPDVPVVFLHGVGFGVLPYLHLVRDIQQACGATPVIMVEVPHVALRLCWEARGVDDVAHAVAALLARHGYRRASVVGHSYGTFVASRLCQLHPQLVHSACLLDPVAMLTCYPQLLYNFIYKEPSASNFTSVGGAIDLLRFMCSRDLTIAQAFCRKFHWSELMIWPQDLPRRSLVVLSGQDDLVPSELVMAHMKLTGHPGKVMHHPNLGHGGILLDPTWQAQFVANLRSMLSTRH